MAINRPNKPSATLPEDFGGVQTAYTESQIENGYLDGVPQVVDGGNMNYERKGLFQGMKYLRTIVDFIRDTPIGKIFWINQNGQMDYIEPAIIATDIEFNTGTATDKTPNVKQVVDNLEIKANNNAVVHKTGNEIITGSKTFTGTLGIPSDNLITKQDNAMEGGQINFEKPTNSSLTGNANIDIYGNRMRFLGRNSSNNYTTPLFLDLETNIAFATASDAVNSVVTTTGISKSENGFVKLGNGIIIQWGRKPSYVSPDPQSVTFPTPFTSTNYKAVCTYFRTGGGVDSGKDHISVDTQSTTGFTFRMSDTTAYGVNWIAIGY